MSLTARITVSEEIEIEVECSECGDELVCETVRNGRYMVVPCKTCLRARWKEGYATGIEAEEAK